MSLYYHIPKITSKLPYTFNMKYPVLGYLRRIIENLSSWEIVDVETEQGALNNPTTTKLVIKNTASSLNYEPHLGFKSDDSTIYIMPFKSYDPSKDFHEQEGAINNDGNYIYYKINFPSNVKDPIPPRVFIGDSFVYLHIPYYRRIYSTYRYYFYYFMFEVFDCIDKDTGGMVIYTFPLKGEQYNPTIPIDLYYNNIWYSYNFNSLYNNIARWDIDKSKNLLTDPSLTSSLNIAKRSYFVNVSNDQSNPIFKYVGTGQKTTKITEITSQNSFYFGGGDYYPIYFFYLKQRLLQNIVTSYFNKETNSIQNCLILGHWAYPLVFDIETEVVNLPPIEINDYY